LGIARCSSYTLASVLFAFVIKEEEKFQVRVSLYFFVDTRLIPLDGLLVVDSGVVEILISPFNC